MTNVEGVGSQSTWVMSVRAVRAVRAPFLAVRTVLKYKFGIAKPEGRNGLWPRVCWSAFVGRCHLGESKLVTKPNRASRWPLRSLDDLMNRSTASSNHRGLDAVISVPSLEWMIT